MPCRSKLKLRKRNCRYKWLIRPLIHRNAIASLGWIGKSAPVPLHYLKKGEEGRKKKEVLHLSRCYTHTHYTRIHYATLRCTTPHYITLHYCTTTTTAGLITVHYNYNSITLQLQLQLHYTTLHPAVVGEVTAAIIATTPKNTSPTTFRSMSGFAVPSVIHNNSPLL